MSTSKRAPARTVDQAMPAQGTQMDTPTVSLAELRAILGPDLQGNSMGALLLQHLAQTQKSRI
jgi:hypothetical protein